MKKLFNHTKKPRDSWDESEYDPADYDWDEIADDSESIEGDEDADTYEEVEYYQETGEYYPAETYDEGVEYETVEDAVYETTEEYWEAEEIIVEEYASENSEYYTDEVEDYVTEDGEYYEESVVAGTAYGVEYSSEVSAEAGYETAECAEEYVAEGYSDEGYSDEEYAEEQYDEEVYYEAEELAEDYDAEPVKAAALPARKKKQNDDSLMDRIMIITGAAILLLAVIVGVIFVSSRSEKNQQSVFADVGSQLQGIHMIGESGLLAVADARIAQLQAAEIVEKEEEKENTDYNEQDYKNGGAVELDMVSIKKDLKIKFSNKQTGKLISNVPFSVSVTGPDGKVQSWLDDDMDGIIYKKNITPGKYEISVDSLNADKYGGYVLPTASQKVEVKEEIAYEKVDVKNEIKKESEVNASKEDTKVNETKVESVLQDTVQWVESKVIASTYVEIDKSAIPDPMKLALHARFLRTTGYTASITGATELVLGTAVETTLTAAVADANGTAAEIKGTTWSSSDTSIATVDASGKVTALKAGSATITCEVTYEYSETVSGSDVQVKTATVTATATVTVSEAALTKGAITVTPDSLTVGVKKKGTVTAAVSGFTAGKALVYSVTTDNAAAADVAVDQAGVVTVTGKAAGTAKVTLTADYAESGSDATKATVTFEVTVVDAPVITLDPAVLTAYVKEESKIQATITNPVKDKKLTVVSSNDAIAKVAVTDNVITVTGVAEGSAVITVKYLEGEDEVLVTCAVTVKPSPKEDKTTKLKDAKGNILYVMEGNKYREAVHADYYTAEKFFIKGAAKYTGWQTIDGKVYFFNASGDKVTGEQVIQGAKYTFASDGSLVVGDGVMGIDVSKWNGTIDWAAVKNSGISYVIIRCGYRGSSEGTLIEDPKFKTNIEGAAKAGLKVGVYFFTQAIDDVEAVEEASMVLELVKNYKISYPIFLDVEPSGGRADKIDKATRTAVCKAFCETIKKAGYTAGIYANKTWLNEKIDASALGSHKIWLAQYAATPTYSGKYDLWQYSSTGRVSGISGDVDLNVSYLGY